MPPDTENSPAPESSPLAHPPKAAIIAIAGAVVLAGVGYYALTHLDQIRDDFHAGKILTPEEIHANLLSEGIPEVVEVGINEEEASKRWQEIRQNPPAPQEPLSPQKAAELAGSAPAEVLPVGGKPSGVKPSPRPKPSPPQPPPRDNPLMGESGIPGVIPPGE